MKKFDQRCSACPSSEFSFERRVVKTNIIHINKKAKEAGRETKNIFSENSTLLLAVSTATGKKYKIIKHSTALSAPCIILPSRILTMLGEKSLARYFTCIMTDRPPNPSKNAHRIIFPLFSLTPSVTSKNAEMIFAASLFKISLSTK